MKPLFVQWGGGNIGRSFIARVFFQSGFRILFIDINQGLVDALNMTRSYTIESVFEEKTTTLVVSDVSAIHASDQEAVNEAIAEAAFLRVPELGADRLGQNLHPALHVLHRLAFPQQFP